MSYYATPQKYVFSQKYVQLNKNYFPYSPSNAFDALAINSPIQQACNYYYCKECDTFESNHLCPKTKNYISTSIQYKRRLNSVSKKLF